MIYLTKNQANTVITTCRELCGNQVNPYYTWYIENKNTLAGVYFYAENNSQSPYYDSFTISLTSSVGLTAGNLNLDAGQWRYEVWEQGQPYILTTASSTNMVETGIMIVVGTYSPIMAFTGSDNSTINVYQNLDRI